MDSFRQLVYTVEARLHGEVADKLSPQELTEQLEEVKVRLAESILFIIR